MDKEPTTSGCNSVAIWVHRTDGGLLEFDRYPLQDDAGSTHPLFYLTNDPEAVCSGLHIPERHVVNVLAASAYLFPECLVERPESLLACDTPSAEALYAYGETLLQKLRDYPLWALETIELLLREIDEQGLAALFGSFAEACRRSGKNCGAWSQSFKPELNRPEKRHVPAHEDCSPLVENEVCAALVPGGAFSTIMPGYESRPGQVEMLRAIVRAFNAGHHLIVEAGTGVGKSLAYLLPSAAWALLNDTPVVISTNTRNLQSQLLEKDLPLVRAALAHTQGTDRAHLDLKVSVLKGRSNYLCLRQIGVLLEHGQFELDRHEMRLFSELISWSVQTTTGDLDAFCGSGHPDVSFYAKVSSIGEECPGRACRYYRRCFLQQARMRAQLSHLVIANHSLVFSDLQADAGFLPTYAHVVFDEAHNLEENATRHLSVEITEHRFQQMIRRLTRGRSKRPAGVLDMLESHLTKGAVTTQDELANKIRMQIREVRKLLETSTQASHALLTLFHALVQNEKGALRYRCEKHSPSSPLADFCADDAALVNLYERFVARQGAFLSCADLLDEQQVAHCCAQLCDALNRASAQLIVLGELLRLAAQDELPLYGDQAANVEGASAVLRCYAQDVRFMVDADDREYVFWVEPQRAHHGESVNLLAAPLSIANALNETLYTRKTSIVFCSATLRVGDSFDYIGRRLGFNQLEAGRIKTCVASSPFNYTTQCLTLAASFLPEPGGIDSGNYTEQLSALLLDVFVRTKGRAMGLFTSYEMMHQIARVLEEPLRQEGIRLLVHGTHGTRDQITRLFRSGKASVLFGTHSFWEGVDVAGDALSCVVMARLPFAVVGDPIVEARCEQIEQRGGSAFREFSLPQAVIRFKQGFGRLIRTRSDRGIVIVADPRIFTKNYGMTFRKSLPGSVINPQDRAGLLQRIESFFKDE